jgi:hypothetical protein
MPNCPVCGKEVQSSTQYCPACGTNLQTSSSGSTSPTGSFGSPYSYQAMRPAPDHRSHRKFLIGIVAAVIISLLIGGAIGYFVGPFTDFTDLTGTVTLSQSNATPNAIEFTSPDYGNLTSKVSPTGSYRIILPMGPTYSVTVQWLNITSNLIQRCIPAPSTFMSSNPTDTGNFHC